MYEAFYKLRGKPFQLNPDPGFYFASRGHKRAMSYLEYGLHQSEVSLIRPADKKLRAIDHPVIAVTHSRRLHHTTGVRAGIRLRLRKATALLTANNGPGEAPLLILIAIVEKGIHPISTPRKGNSRLEELFEEQHLAEHAHTAAAEFRGAIHRHPMVRIRASGKADPINLFDHRRLRRHRHSWFSEMYKPCRRDRRGNSRNNPLRTGLTCGLLRARAC